MTIGLGLRHETKLCTMVKLTATLNSDNIIVNVLKNTTKYKSSPMLRMSLVTTALLLSSACQANSDIAQGKQKEPKMQESHSRVEQTADCPLISSNNWRAQIVSIDGLRQLKLNGDIELPNPGFAVTIEPGIADRSLKPTQHFHVKLERLNGFHIQVITPMSIEQLSPAIAPEYTSIVIHCGKQTLSTITDIRES